MSQLTLIDKLFEDLTRTLNHVCPMSNWVPDCFSIRHDTFICVRIACHTGYYRNICKECNKIIDLYHNKYINLDLYHRLSKIEEKIDLLIRLNTQ